MTWLAYTTSKIWQKQDKQCYIRTSSRVRNAAQDSFSHKEAQAATESGLHRGTNLRQINLFVKPHVSVRLMWSSCIGSEASTPGACHCPQSKTLCCVWNSSTCSSGQLVRTSRRTKLHSEPLGPPLSMVLLFYIYIYIIQVSLFYTV